MTNYPCRECLLLGNCSESCANKLILDTKLLAKYLIRNKNCPDCGNDSLIWTMDIGILYTDVLCKVCFSRFAFILDQILSYPYISKDIGSIEVRRFPKIYKKCYKSIPFKKFLIDYEIGSN
jgi:ferredoxin